MFHRVTLRVADLAASRRFYATVLRTLRAERTATGPGWADWQDLRLREAGPADPPTAGLHLGFVAPTPAHADEFWRAGTRAGYPDDGAPGRRTVYGPDYYGAFLRDPDGNSAEAVHLDRARRGGIVDHLWIRVADVAASRRFYEAIAGPAGFALNAEWPEEDPALPHRAQFRGASGSFSVVDGTPAANVHLAFATREEAALDAFRAAAGEGGGRLADAEGEDGGPVAVDPDGNTVALVFRPARRPAA